METNRLFMDHAKTGSNTLIGKQFRLKSDTVAVDEADGEAVAITLPKGAILKVVDDSGDHDRFLDVTWDGRPCAVFLSDLQDRGEEIADHSAGAH